MNFRVSPQEKELIDARIALTGLSRSEFFYIKLFVSENSRKRNIKAFWRNESKDIRACRGN